MSEASKRPASPGSMTHKDENDQKEYDANIGQHGKRKIDSHHDLMEASRPRDELDDPQDSEDPQNGKGISRAWREEIQQDSLRRRRRID